MAWEDHERIDLLSIAREHELAGITSNSDKPELIAALKKAGIPEPGTHEVSGVQPGQPVPKIPVTRADFDELKLNPELPAENQAAPPQDLLNPHLFPQG